MEQYNFKKGFTFVELLIVILVIGILGTVSGQMVATLSRQSRDARRKSDLEEIRSALEMYRASNTTYPDQASIVGGVSICDPTPTGCPPGGKLYLQKIPQDPASPVQKYYYTAGSTAFTLGAQLETGNSVCTPALSGSNSCGTGYPCNYCTGKYGKL